jgi:hypothetical protein
MPRMSTDPSRSLLPPRAARLLGWGVLYAILIIGSFNFPLMPSADLDPSWRMALGYFFENGMRFGSDVVFTYGPLGFIMGKTFSGYQFWELIAGQLTLAIISGTVLLRQGLRIQGYNRYLYIVFVLVFGTLYEDALHMIVITILGFELLRLKESPRHSFLVLIAAVLAFYAQIKFTDFLLAGYIVGLTVTYGLWKRQWPAVLTFGVSFVVIYLGIWVYFGQNLSDLPAYFRGSWEISQGYQWAMGFPSPFAPLWKGLIVLAGLIIYALVHLKIHPDKPRAIANTLLLAAFVYLNWKHGFVRADGHMIGFFFCALLPLTAYPHLLDDSERLAKPHRWSFIFLIFLSVWALENVLTGVVSHSLATFQNKVWGNIASVVNWERTRQGYREHLIVARNATVMPQTKELAGDRTVDVLGSEQGVALFNRFNYRPRPVIQSYSTFTPALSRLNRDFYASANAPDFVLMKIQSIDYRLPSIDDSHVLRLLPHRYEYVLSENGFLVWQRRPGEFDRAAVEPRPLRSIDLAVNRPLSLEQENHQPLWIEIDLQPTLLGKIRSFLYKPPQVTLRILNSDDNATDYLMPLPQGRTGFVINPVIEDYVDYMHFASNTPDKLARALTLKIAPADEKYFRPAAHVRLFTLPASAAGQSYFPPSTADKFPMFHSYPVLYDSMAPMISAQVDDREVAMLHAPSRMVFDFPSKAKKLTGEFGFLTAAYTQEGNTNGALFVIYWSDGTRRVDLYQRFLNPVHIAFDRGIQDFNVSLTHLSGGRIYFEIHPGPQNEFAWDWTFWTNIKISR